MTWSWLQRYVADVRVVDFADAKNGIMRLPDGRTSLYLRTFAGRRGGDLTLAGPRTRALRKTSGEVARAIAIKLKPGWSTQLFGAPVRLLTDRYVQLHELWGAAGADLRDELLALDDPADVLEAIARAVAARTSQLSDPSSARLARRAVQLIDREALSIAEVAARLGVTPRHLRRSFVENIGVGPKDYARAVRLRRAVDSMAHARAGADWGQIAAAAGYYDQAHLHLDFRALVGLTPRAFEALRVSTDVGARVQ